MGKHHCLLTVTSRAFLKHITVCIGFSHSQKSSKAGSPLRREERGPYIPYLQQRPACRAADLQQTHPASVYVAFSPRLRLVQIWVSFHSKSENRRSWHHTDLCQTNVPALERGQLRKQMWKGNVRNFTPCPSWEHALVRVRGLSSATLERRDSASWYGSFLEAFCSRKVKVS